MGKIYKISCSCKKFITFLLFITVFCGNFIQVVLGAQKFEKQPDYNEVNPGQEARLTCKIFQKKGQCSWQKDNKPVGIYLGKYEWAGNPDVGDCSLRVLNSVLEYDDGEWECQVTASDFAAQDALTSKPVKLVVRVPPDTPQIGYNGTSISVGKNLTSQSGQRASVKCISRNGNPAPLLKWFVGNEELSGVSQINKTEDDNPKKWSAVSTLDYAFLKSHNGKSLKCLAVHEAYPTKARDAQIVLDIQYAPQVKLLGLPEGDLEENKSKLTLRCIADSNPPSNIIWKKTGGSQVFGYQEAIEFRPLVRKHTGTYTCEAKNFLGVSQSANVEVDVKYPPKITRVGPERMVMATLYNRTVLQCLAEGNPQPTYQWLQQMTSAEESNTYVRGSDHMLVIQNVTYDFQGKYLCKAKNVISGTERTTQSDPIELHVTGAPQILRHSVEPEIEIEKGSEAKLTVIFCSNPGPTKAIWDWGSLQLESGYEMGRFSAESITKIARANCYEARLRIVNADSSDTRHYYLTVENARGSDKYSVNLQVRGYDFVFADPVSMSIVITVIIGCLLLLVIVVLIILYAFKAEKWCFSQRGEFKPTDLESEKSDMSGSTKVTVGGENGGGNNQKNGKSNSIAIPQQSALHFGHHRTRMKNNRQSDSNIPSDFHIKQQQNQQPNFRSRAYPATSVTVIDATKKDINYSDLQLPKTSNNGSMKKSNKNHQQRPSIITDALTAQSSSSTTSANTKQPQQHHHHHHNNHNHHHNNHSNSNNISSIPVLQSPQRRSNASSNTNELQLNFIRQNEQVEV